jgi:hypothetical protein
MIPRLEYIAVPLADSGKLPSGPVLLWREGDRTVKYVAVGVELFVGRKAGGR